MNNIQHIAMSVAVTACMFALVGCYLQNEIGILFSIGAIFLCVLVIKLNHDKQ